MCLFLQLRVLSFLGEHAFCLLLGRNSSDDEVWEGSAECRPLLDAADTVEPILHQCLSLLVANLSQTPRQSMTKQGDEDSSGFQNALPSSSPVLLSALPPLPAVMRPMSVTAITSVFIQVRSREPQQRGKAGSSLCASALVKVRLSIHQPDCEPVE